MAMRYGFIGCSLEQTNFPKLGLQKQETFLFLQMSMQVCQLQYKIIGSRKVAMLIQTDKYQPNSLRRGRQEAIEKDLSDIFTIFSNRFSDPKVITMNDFVSFWNNSQMKFLVYLRNEEEDEQQYFQIIYKILISDYFVKGTQSKKIYSLLSMYFFAYTVDSNGDRNPRFIHVNVEFLNALCSFLKENQAFSTQLFIKVVKRIKELFIYSIKLGARQPLIKKNGQTYIRYPKSNKKLTVDNYSPTILQIKDFLPGLDETIKSYQQSKQALFKNCKDETINNYKRQMNFDKNITKRLTQIMRSYDAEVTYGDEDMKNVADQE